MASLALGLDIGSSSVGWALVSLRDGAPEGLVGLGARIFEPGVVGSVEQGREESRNLKRRQQRQQRRQTGRRRARLRSVYRVLAEAGLLPALEHGRPWHLQIHEALESVDARLRAKHLAQGDHLGQQVLFYRLRAKALAEPLEAHELGRVLYQLAQRRGYRPHRQAEASAKDDDEELGQVKAGIEELQRRMSVEGQPTIGALFSTFDPDAERIRGPGRWTSRDWFRDEFKAICAAQKVHHAGLTPEVEDKLSPAIFHQRPLRSQAGLVGRCELEPGHVRASLARLEVQQFRIVQTVNNLRVLEEGREQRSLTAQERAMLRAGLDAQDSMTPTKIKQLLGLPARKARLNVELRAESGEAGKIPGNRTASRLRRVLSNRWDAMDEAAKATLVEDLLSIRDPDVLRRRLMGPAHGLDDTLARRVADVRLESGRAAISLKAMRHLLPVMIDDGTSFAEARMRLYGKDVKPPLPLLPPVDKDFPQLRQPTVHRALSEVRAVVNALVRKHGKPDVIRIELARDLKHPRAVREAMWKRIEARRREREGFARKILEQNAQQTGANIERWELAVECGFQCPYTGRSFSAQDLLSPASPLQVEHILPYSRTLDNSFENKTLCFRDENARKHNRSPWEAYGGTAQYDELIRRVREFKGSDKRTKASKLDRFLRQTLAGDIEEEFSARQLSETRYATRLAAEYVGKLFGGAGGVDDEGRLRVQTSAGGATAILRREWNLNRVLGLDGEKNRAHHGHHAVDAVVVALTDRRAVHEIARAAMDAAASGSTRRLRPIPLPWTSLEKDVRKAIDGLVVSHRTSHRLRGGLHQETNYGMSPGGATGVVRIRKEVQRLAAKDVARIADPGVRRAVEEKLRELGAESPAEAFKGAGTLPALKTRSGSSIPIKRVRLEVKKTTVAVGSHVARRQRLNEPGSNHHMAVVETVGHEGRPVRWEDHVVSRFMATERQRRGEPVVQQDWGPDRRLVFTLAAGDSVGRQKDDASWELRVVKAVSAGVVEMLANTDARSTRAIRTEGAAGGRFKLGAERLRLEFWQKVTVSPIGEVAPARD